ncbi:putative retrotransposon hot spot (RHS) protein [Trypanosoma cruzi]|nr:putative retrotransposon hot spot (RHS) protein [Trypanosoma cruzi]
MGGCAAAQPWPPRPPSRQPATRTHNLQKVTRHRRASSTVFPNAFLNASYDPHTTTIVEHVLTTEYRYERESTSPHIRCCSGGRKTHTHAHAHTQTLRIRPGTA